MKNNAKRRMYVLTNGFPYGNSERSFLRTEADGLAKEFDVVYLPYHIEGEKGADFATKPFRPAGISTKIKCFIKSFVQGGFWRELFRCCREAEGNMAACFKTVLLYNFNANLVSEFLLKYVLQKGGEGIVYSYWYSELCLGAVRLKKKFSGYRFVTRTHGCDLYDERTALHYQPFKCEMENLLDRIVFAAQSSKNYYLNRYRKKDSEKYCVSRIGAQGYQRPEYKMQEGKLTILSCSAMVEIKRIPLIIDALMGITEYEIVWFHVGGGEMEKSVREYAECLNSRHNISCKFMGNMLHDDYIGWLEKQPIDLFITTSATEGGCPVAIAEALSFGIPVIGTCVGGIPEMLAYGNGILLEENPSPEEVREAVLNFADMSEQERSRMRRNALHAWERDFDSRKTSERFVRTMSKL